MGGVEIPPVKNTKNFMKKLLYTLAGLSALALFASCNKEAQLSGGEDGATVKASFTVQLPDAVQTKAISDGGGAIQLLFKVYDQSNKHLPNLDQTITVSDRKATVTVNLVKGVKYQYVFWAQKEAKYTINDTDNSITIDPQAMMNSDDWDAFYWHEPLEEVTAAFSKTITLHRPFAQINVGAPVTLDANEERTGGDFWAASQSDILIDNNLTTSYTIEVPNKLNLLDGSVEGAFSLPMNAVAHPTEFLTVDGVKYDYAAMAYVLAGTTGTTKDLVLKLNTKQNGTAIELTRNVPNVPLRRNYRTNILGNVFTVTGTFNIVVDQNFFKVDGYNDDYFPQYASIDALNAAFAAGKGIGYTVEVAPAAAVSGDQTIVLPNTQDEVSIFFRGDFSAADITIAYSSEADAKKPAKLTIEAPLVGSATQSINKLIGNLPATTVVLAGTTTVNTADFHTASNTLHIMPEAQILNQLTVYAGSLLVEGFIETAIIDPAVAVNTVDAVATVAEDGEVVRFVVQNLTTKIESGAKVGTLEVSTTAAYTGEAPKVTIEGGAEVGGVVADTEVGATVAPTVEVKDDANVETIEQKGDAKVNISEDANVGEVEAEDLSNITGDGAEDVEFLIKNEAQLTAAIEAKKASMKIGADFACNRGYLLDYSAEIDLNGHAITFNGVPGEGREYVAEGFTQSRAFKVVGSADFTLKNGSVLLNEALLGSVRFDSTGKLTLENYITTNYRGWGLNIKLEHGTAELKNVTVTSQVGGCLEVNGPAQATLSGCTFTQTGEDSESWISSAISVAYAGVVNVASGTYSGVYGAYAFTSGGTINLNGGTVSGSKAALILQTDRVDYPTSVSSINVIPGAEVTGALRADHQYCNLTISGGLFAKGAAEHQFVINPASTVSITGGTFDEDPSAYVSADYGVRLKDGKYQVGIFPKEINISTAEEFINVFSDPATKSKNTEINILADIDLSSSAAHEPFDISNSENASITVNGNGHTITGMKKPMFDQCFVASIAVNNLTFDSCNITEASNGYVAVIAAYFDAGKSLNVENVTISNCTLSCDSENGLGSNYVGAIYGAGGGYGNQNDGPVHMGALVKNCTITNCTFEAKTYGGSVGAIAGHAAWNNWTKLTVENCAVTNCNLSTGKANKAGSYFGTVGCAGVTPLYGRECGIYMKGCSWSGNVATAKGVVAPYIFGRVAQDGGELWIYENTDYVRAAHFDDVDVIDRPDLVSEN